MSFIIGGGENQQPVRLPLLLLGSSDHVIWGWRPLKSLTGPVYRVTMYLYLLNKHSVPRDQTRHAIASASPRPRVQSTELLLTYDVPVLGNRRMARCVEEKSV